MLDDHRDKSLQRNQLIAIVLMSVLFVGWSYFFLPKPQPVAPTPPEQVQTAQAESSQSSATPAPLPEKEALAAPPLTGVEEGLLDKLPPVVEGVPLPAEEVHLSNAHLDLVFTPVGARLKRGTVILGKEGADSVQLVPDWGGEADASAVYPLGLRFAPDFLGDSLDQRAWTVVQDSAVDEVIFQIRVEGLAEIRKTFRLGDAANLLYVDVSYTNLEGKTRRLGLDTEQPAYSLYWAPNVNSGDEHKGVKQEVIWRREGANEHFPTKKLEAVAPGAFSEYAVDVDWAAIRSAYFVVALALEETEDASAWIAGDADHFRVGMGAPRYEATVEQSQVTTFSVYLGPNKGSILKGAWPNLDTVWEFFTTVKIMDRFAKLLLGLLNWFHGSVIANYGLAIIFLTLVVRGIMFPLTIKSMKSMKRMQKLAPEMEKLKAEVGDDQQELQKRTMELYRERGVNPLGGCLPLLLQMPVFIALYRMLWSAVELRRAPFVGWIVDLSEPDQLLQLPFSIPLPLMSSELEYFNLLPILMALSMVVSQKLMPTSGPVQTQQQKMMMTFMPIFFGFICYNMAAGLNLYILTSTLLGIAQNYVVNRIDMDVEPVKKKKRPASKRPQHFYNAAQARKREMAKEARKEKRSKQRRADTPPEKRSGRKRS